MPIGWIGSTGRRVFLDTGAFGVLLYLCNKNTRCLTRIVSESDSMHARLEEPPIVLREEGQEVVPFNDWKSVLRFVCEGKGATTVLQKEGGTWVFTKCQVQIR